jgi:CheY-like chemotaxis protein
MDVLVVDDQEDIRALVRAALGAAGLGVREAVSGLEALEQLATGPAPDVVVLDIQMPDVDGWEVLRIIRGTASTADLPVILCTVKASVADAERGWRLGADAYVTKPFAVDRLIDDVCRVATSLVADRHSARRRAIDEIVRAAASRADRVS